MDVLVYARLSRSHDSSTSIERQLEACRTEAERRGWTVIGEYVDDGVSGATDLEARPGMSRLLAKLGDADAVLVWKLDRLARSFLSFADLTRDCERAGVGITSVTEPLDTTTPMGRAMVRIIAIFAELERDMIRERIIATREHLATTDRFYTGRAPYGLRIVPAPDGPGSVLERDPVAAEVIREIVGRINSGEAATAIATDLQRRGVASPRVQTATKADPKPAAWSYTSVTKIIEHPSLLGHKLDSHGHVRRDDTGAEIEFWPPVVSRRDAEAARRALAARSRDHSSPANRHWLYGVAVCSRCERPLTQNAKHHRSITVLRCTGRRSAPCKGVSVRASELIDYVEREFIATVGRFDAVERVLVPGEDHRDELGSIDRALERLRDDRDAGLFDTDADDYRSRVSALVARRDALRAAPVTADQWEDRPLGMTFVEHWRSLDPAERGDLLRSMGIRVVVMPAGGKRLPVEDRARVEFPGA